MLVLTTTLLLKCPQLQVLQELAVETQQVTTDGTDARHSYSE